MNKEIAKKVLGLLEKAENTSDSGERTIIFDCLLAFIEGVAMQSIED